MIPYRSGRRVTAVLVAGLAVAGCVGCHRSAGATEGDAVIRTAVADASPTPTGTATAETLTDAGIGGLRLGDDVHTAITRGWVGSRLGTRRGCVRYDGRRGVDSVLVNDRGQVAVIAVRPSVRTERGIGVGSSYRQLHAVYPDADEVDRALQAPAPAAPVPARYVFGMDSGDVIYPFDTVRAVSLVSERDACQS